MRPSGLKKAHDACARLLLLPAAKAVIAHTASYQSELLLLTQFKHSRVGWRISSVNRGVLCTYIE